MSLIKKGTFLATALDAIPTPMGPVKFMDNNSLIQTAYIGQSRANGQFKIIWTSPAAVTPDLYDPVAFPGKTCKI